MKKSRRPSPQKGFGFRESWGKAAQCAQNVLGLTAAKGGGQLGRKAGVANSNYLPCHVARRRSGQRINIPEYCCGLPVSPRGHRSTCWKRGPHHGDGRGAKPFRAGRNGVPGGPAFGRDLCWAGRVSEFSESRSQSASLALVPSGFLAHHHLLCTHSCQ